MVPMVYDSRMSDDALALVDADPDAEVTRAERVQDAFLAYLGDRDPDVRSWLNGVGITVAGFSDLLRRGRVTDGEIAWLRRNARPAIKIGYLPGRLPAVLAPFARGQRFLGHVVEVEESAPAVAQGVRADRSDRSDRSDPSDPSDPVAAVLQRLGMGGPGTAGFTGLVGLMPGQRYPEGTAGTAGTIENCSGDPEVARRFVRAFGRDAGIDLLNLALRRGWRFVRVRARAGAGADAGDVLGDGKQFLRDYLNVLTFRPIAAMEKQALQYVLAGIWRAANPPPNVVVEYKRLLDGGYLPEGPSVYAFQRAYNASQNASVLPEDGIVGPATVAAMRAVAMGTMGTMPGRTGETGALLATVETTDPFRQLLDVILRRVRPAQQYTRIEPLRVGSKVIDLGDAPLHFVNSFSDSTFLGIKFAGLCGGMAATTLDNFYTGTPAPLIATTPSVQDDALGKYIYSRQVDSLLGWQGAEFLAMLLTADDASLARQTDASFRELVSAIDEGTPVPIGLIPAPYTLDITKFTKAHQVVARGYAVGEDGSKTVYLWDSNRPNDLDTVLVQAPGSTLWIEPAAPGSSEHAWRGWFVESAYTAKQPPVASGSANDAFSVPILNVPDLAPARVPARAPAPAPAPGASRAIKTSGTLDNAFVLGLVDPLGQAGPAVKNADAGDVSDVGDVGFVLRNDQRLAGLAGTPMGPPFRSARGQRALRRRPRDSDPWGRSWVAPDR
jgi:hypothetical protein